jgi:hypothetical protein
MMVDLALVYNNELKQNNANAVVVGSCGGVLGVRQKRIEIFFVAQRPQGGARRKVLTRHVPCVRDAE